MMECLLVSRVSRMKKPLIITSESLDGSLSSLPLSSFYLLFIFFQSLSISFLAAGTYE